MNGGTITGNIETLFVQQNLSFGDGGLATFVIEGELQGNATVPKLLDVTIGSLGTSAFLNADTIIEGGRLQIGPQLGACATGAPATKKMVQIDTIENGAALIFDGNLSANVSVGAITGGQFIVEGGVEDVQIVIGNMSSQSNPGGVTFGSSASGPCPFFGELVINGTLPAGTSVEFNGPFDATASIGMVGQSIKGTMALKAGGAGTIVAGGVGLSGTLTLAEGASSSFSGSVTLVGLSIGGILETTAGADLEGTVTFPFSIGGTVDVDGDLGKNGRILIGGDSLGSVVVGGNQRGSIDVGSNIGSAGSIAIGGNLTGDIHMGGDMLGSIDVKSLARGGRITADGLGDGPITVKEGTFNSTFIHLNDGLGAGGSIVIDDMGGAFDAGGSVQIGPDIDKYAPMPPVVFDGCILIKDDLSGHIDVNGCHAADTADLNVCVLGAMKGTISINQDTCPDPVGLDNSCINPCP